MQWQKEWRILIHMGVLKRLPSPADIRFILRNKPLASNNFKANNVPMLHKSVTMSQI
jgi:hypothetical protein